MVRDFENIFEAGFEPAISSLGGRRLIHEATRTVFCTLNQNRGFVCGHAPSKSISKIVFASGWAWFWDKPAPRRGSETEQKGRGNEGARFQSGEGDKGSGQTRKAAGASAVRGPDGWEIWP